MLRYTFSNLAPAENDAYLVASSRPTINGNYKPMFLLPFRSPISPMVQWRPQGVRGSLENIEDDRKSFNFYNIFSDEKRTISEPYLSFCLLCTL